MNYQRTGMKHCSTMPVKLFEQIHVLRLVMHLQKFYWQDLWFILLNLEKWKSITKVSCIYLIFRGTKSVRWHHLKSGFVFEEPFWRNNCGIICLELIKKFLDLQARKSKRINEDTKRTMTSERKCLRFRLLLEIKLNIAGIKTRRRSQRVEFRGFHAAVIVLFIEWTTRKRLLLFEISTEQF